MNDSAYFRTVASEALSRARIATSHPLLSLMAKVETSGVIREERPYEPVRSHTCGSLRLSDATSSVTLAGWVQLARDKGHFCFVDLRDRCALLRGQLRQNGPRARSSWPLSFATPFLRLLITKPYSDMVSHRLWCLPRRRTCTRWPRSSVRLSKSPLSSSKVIIRRPRVGGSREGYRRGALQQEP